MDKSTRVLLLTQWFDPEPAFKGLIFARELVKRGFDVEVVTGLPNYPGGRFYPGYKLKLLQREVLDGILVTRVPLYPSHDQSVTKRALNYLSFAASSLIYCLFVAERADVMYAYHPPLTVGITASIVRMIRGFPVVYDIQDMWPDTLRATGMLSNARALRVVGRLCEWVYHRVDQIVVLSPGFKRLLVQRGVPEAKVSVIFNWADEPSLSVPADEVPTLFAGHDRFFILFAGNIGKAQALDTVVQAAELLQMQGSRICWVMLGGGVEVERLKVEVTRRQLNNLVFLPAVPMAKVGAYLQAADALLVHLRKDPLFEITIPSKTQAYMFVGKPLLMAVNGDAADLVRQSGCGVVAESESPQALVQAAQTLANSDTDSLAAMSYQAKEFYQQHLSLAVGVDSFCRQFKMVAYTTIVIK